MDKMAANEQNMKATLRMVVCNIRVYGFGASVSHFAAYCDEDFSHCVLSSAIRMCHAICVYKL